MLKQVNARAGTLQADRQALRRISDAYGAAAPDILTALDAATPTGAAIVDNAAGLDHLLTGVIGLARGGIDLIGSSQADLTRAVGLFESTARLLVKYQPTFTCTLVGAKTALDTGYLDATGGANHKSIVLDSALLFGPDAYRYPQNLPVIGARGGPGGEPGCGSLPDVAANWPVRQLITNTGWGTGLDIRPNPGIGFPATPTTFRSPGRSRSAERPLSRRARTRTDSHPAPRRTERSSTPRWDTAVARPSTRPPPGAARARPDHRRRARNHSWCRCPLSCNRHPHRRRPMPGHPCHDEAGMKENLSGAMLRVGVFLAVCTLGLVAMLAVFAQLRFETEKTYAAEFHTVSGLENGNFVRIAGVEVGKVRTIRIRDDGIALVEFGADASVVLTEGSRAVIRYRNLIGERYLALEEGAGGTRRLPAGATIPLARTAPALDLDALLGGFRPLFHALNPDQVNALSEQLVAALQGEGATLTDFPPDRRRDQHAGRPGSADRRRHREPEDHHGALADQSTQFAGAVDAPGRSTGDHRKPKAGPAQRTRLR